MLCDLPPRLQKYKQRNVGTGQSEVEDGRRVNSLDRTHPSLGQQSLRDQLDEMCVSSLRHLQANGPSGLPTEIGEVAAWAQHPLLTPQAFCFLHHVPSHGWNFPGEMETEESQPVPLLHAYVNAFKEKLIENQNCAEV